MNIGMWKKTEQHFVPVSLCLVFVKVSDNRINSQIVAELASIVIPLKLHAYTPCFYANKTPSGHYTMLGEGFQYGTLWGNVKSTPV